LQTVKKRKMKKILLLIMIPLFHNLCFAQVESLNSKKVVEQFEMFYNQNDYKSIFEMFSSETQKALPLEKISEFLSGLNSKAGKINNREFIKYQKGTFALYKTEFEKITLGLNLSIDDNSKINGIFVKAFIDESIPKIERNITKLQLPFKKEWTVIWGGDTKELNYHVESEMQKNAFDILITDKKGNSYKTNGKSNEDYYAFGKELFAPCDGEIVKVLDGIVDNKVGEMNSIDVTGNTVIIKTNNNEYLFFCHFKNGTIKLKEGEKVKQGQLLGLCGNSGHSSEPHLHFHIQNTKDINSGTGIKCYFEKLKVNGKLKEDYSPIQNDKISIEKK
jgi:murein DD-endopeptidase MepM/ murein hydrolase activator NlpD